ncbi:hypothetical protein TNCV_5113991 [Trichonephila clavipes]|nr:hypothetical protein TNCV_5113991 [Trichonephila clavipes]
MLSQFSPSKMTSRAGSSSISLSSRISSSSSSTPLSSRVSSSSSTLSSNPGSPVSLNRERKDSSSDTEYNPKTYTNELAESGLKEERFRIDRKKLEDMLQVQQNGNGKTENAEDFFQKDVFVTTVILPLTKHFVAKNIKECRFISPLERDLRGKVSLNAIPV